MHEAPVDALPESAGTMHITGTETVNAVMRQYPPSVEIFTALGVDACCGGNDTLTAAAHHAGIAPAALIGTLEALVRQCGCVAGSDTPGSL